LSAYEGEELGDEGKGVGMICFCGGCWTRDGKETRRDWGHIRSRREVDHEGLDI